MLRAADTTKLFLAIDLRLMPDWLPRSALGHFTPKFFANPEIFTAMNPVGFMRG